LIDPRRAGLRDLVDRLRRDRMTVLRAAPSLWRVIAATDGAKDALRHLRLARFAGEGPLWTDIDRLREILPSGCVFLNAYNATESPGLYWRGVTADRAIDPVRVPAGRLGSPGEIRIVGPDGAPCQLGEEGELIILSGMNSLGEWHNGALVKGRIRPDPAGSGFSLYPTGDLARQTPDGTVVVLGRVDRLVKMNGLRVELGEIEAALRALPGVNDAAVIARAGSAGQSLIAWVEPRGGVEPGWDGALRSALRNVLPTHMIPARVFTVPGLPRLPAGKVDLSALASMAGERG
jgi:acyl-coenzyme A synthetase/AMP-(fatty) acid ligase